MNRLGQAARYFRRLLATRLHSPRLRLAVGVGFGLGLAAYVGHRQRVTPFNFVLAQCEGRKQYTLAEVAQHKTKENRIWVVYKNGVYDITEWVEKHPGGKEKIMLAAGSSIEPFWRMYQQHNTEEVRKTLEEYRIGDLAEADRVTTPVHTEDPFKNEPTDRHPSLRVLNLRPLNAETPGSLLADSFITPNELHFKRNHLPVPVVKPEEYRLVIQGEGVKRVSFSLQDLQSLFKQYTIPVTTQCSGNRRSELIDIKPIKGLDWLQGAISTAEWTGVKLSDVLAYAGLNEQNFGKVKHIQFEGLDKDMATSTSYGASIPVHKALDPKGDVLLAFKMNGQDLPRDHGYPLRVVVPGIAGARHVKWVSLIQPSSAESSSHWQQRDYKSFSPDVDWPQLNAKTWDEAYSIQELPVTSAICDPQPHIRHPRHKDAPASPLPADQDEIPVKGYAWSGGGRSIIRVEVSADGGQSWHQAELDPRAKAQPEGRAWAWYPWKVNLPLPAPSSTSEPVEKIELVCRAIDSAQNQQPSSAAASWNVRGVANNVWHRVLITRQRVQQQQQQ